LAIVFLMAIGMTEVHTVRRFVQINIMLVGACDDGGGVRRSLSQWTFLIAR